MSFAYDVYNPTLPSGPPQQPLGSPETARPLTDSSFTGMLNTTNEHLEHNYRFTPLSGEVGGTNAGQSSELYQTRLSALKEMNSHTAEEGHAGKAWNERRRAAIERGEDPNSAMLDAIERRKPDSYLERGWRWIRGKPATKYEERMQKERQRSGGASQETDGASQESDNDEEEILKEKKAKGKKEKRREKHDDVVR